MIYVPRSHTVALAEGEVHSRNVEWFVFSFFVAPTSWLHRSAFSIISSFFSYLSVFLLRPLFVAAISVSTFQSQIQLHGRLVNGFYRLPVLKFTLCVVRRHHYIICTFMLTTFGFLVSCSNLISSYFMTSIRWCFGR